MKPELPKFPTMFRKMWSGTEVQQWIDENVAPLLEQTIVPEWIVNDNAELGVKVAGRCFFLYKGESLEYVDGKHDDDTPIKYRPVGKREFGETCVPIKFYKTGELLHDRYTDELTYTPGLSFGEPKDGAWRDLPVISASLSNGASEPVSVPSDADILHTWDSFVSEPNDKYPLTDVDKIGFARALLEKYTAPKPRTDK